MSTAATNRPKPAPAGANVIVINDGNPSDAGKQLMRLIPAVALSVVFHGVLIGLFVLLSPAPKSGPQVEETKSDIVADAPQEEKRESFLVTDIDPTGQEFDTDIQYNVDRIADVSVPGMVNANEAVGIRDGDKNADPTNLPAPGGFGGKGTGGAIEISGVGNSNGIGDAGGYGNRPPLPGSFFGRSGATRERALRDGGGTKESEAAVARGLKWLQRQQSPDGKWMLDGAFKDKGRVDDTAGTAFGLLPLLAAGKTHKPAADNPYDKTVEKGLVYLIRRQDKKNGHLGGDMYSHGLATIAMCEAYGLTQDSSLRRPAQMAVNYIVASQRESGGWEYGGSSNGPGDTSISGWQIMAMKSGLMAGLDVPEAALKKAVKYLDSHESSNGGYGYRGPQGTPTMTAVGLLCRQYLQAWGPQNIKMINGVNNYLKPLPPTNPGAKNNSYYYYYATQVLHHFGGETWKQWNDQMREVLVKSQETTASSPNFGSWSSEKDGHGKAGGRLMITSLNLLTLEVYYRYLPLYYRDAGAKKDMAVGKAL